MPAAEDGRGMCDDTEAPGHEKRCYVCGDIKSLDEFPKFSRMRDGHVNRCLECGRVYSREYRRRNKDKIRAYADSRRGDPRRAATQRESKLRRRINHPEKHRAQNAVSRAIKDGHLVRGPCEVCGSEPAEGHHDDYSKPLDVRWLCLAHHRELHKKQKREV